MYTIYGGKMNINFIRIIGLRGTDCVGKQILKLVLNEQNIGM
jgi:hypothetical protein